MIKTIAGLLIVLLLSCEFNNTISSFLTSTTCCKRICMKTDQGCSEQEKNKCAAKGCVLVKACIECSYVKPDQFSQFFSSPGNLFMIAVNTGMLRSFTNECFHPPEIV